MASLSNQGSPDRDPSDPSKKQGQKPIPTPKSDHAPEDLAHHQLPPSRLLGMQQTLLSALSYIAHEERQLRLTSGHADSSRPQKIRDVATEFTKTWTAYCEFASRLTPSPKRATLSLSPLQQQEAHADGLCLDTLGLLLCDTGLNFLDTFSHLIDLGLGVRETIKKDSLKLPFFSSDSPPSSLKPFLETLVAAAQVESGSLNIPPVPIHDISEIAATKNLARSEQIFNLLGDLFKALQGIEQKTRHIKTLNILGSRCIMTSVETARRLLELTEDWSASSNERLLQSADLAAGFVPPFKHLHPTAACCILEVRVAILAQAAQYPSLLSWVNSRSKSLWEEFKLLTEQQRALKSRSQGSPGNPSAKYVEILRNGIDELLATAHRTWIELTNNDRKHWFDRFGDPLAEIFQNCFEWFCLLQIQSNDLFPPEQADSEHIKSQFQELKTQALHKHIEFLAYSLFWNSSPKTAERLDERVLELMNEYRVEHEPGRSPPEQDEYLCIGTFAEAAAAFAYVGWRQKAHIFCEIAMNLFERRIEEEEKNAHASDATHEITLQSVCGSLDLIWHASKQIHESYSAEGDSFFAESLDEDTFGADRDNAGSADTFIDKINSLFDRACNLPVLQSGLKPTDHPPYAGVLELLAQHAFLLNQVEYPRQAMTKLSRMVHLISLYEDPPETDLRRLRSAIEVARETLELIQEDTAGLNKFELLSKLDEQTRRLTPDDDSD